MPPVKQRALVPVAITAPAVRAVAYVRMSTEHQRYSAFNQLAVIRQYAAEHDLTLVRTYSDEGISGLTMSGRFGLRALIAEVSSGKPDFSKVLVYDISRWGRFQDTDQGAFYEYLCRMNGVDVIYCAEPFQDDQSPLSAVIKAVKRAMAAEYSRELGVRVLRGCCNMASRGFHPSGPAPYGLKTLVVDLNGRIVRTDLSRNRKTQRDLHVVLAPGPAREVRIVREIFRRYTELHESCRRIADYLNKHGYRTRKGRLWVNMSIHHMLRNEKYIGTLTYNRESCRLKTRRIRNDPSKWISKPSAFKAIIDPEVFWRARERQATEGRGPPLSDEELLSMLRSCLAKHGFINKYVLRRSNGMPGSATVQKRFGGLRNAYALVGYKGYSNSENWNERCRVRELRLSLLSAIQDEVSHNGYQMTIDSSSRFFIGRTQCFTISMAKSYTAPIAGKKWRTKSRKRNAADFHIICRLKDDRETALDYYVIPQTAVRTFPERLARRNGLSIDRYRVPTIGKLIERIETSASDDRPSKVRKW